MLQFWKVKFRIGLLLAFVVALMMPALPASAQGSLFDDPLGQSLGGSKGQIFGTVYLNRGAGPASQVTVNIRSLSANVNLNAITDVGGHFELRNLPPGSYEVSAEAPGYGYTSTVTQVSIFPSEINLYLNGPNTSRGGNSYSVSVRELKIPSKALDEYYRGLDRIAKDDTSAGLEHFTKAAAAYPDYYEAFYHIGLAELRLNHLDKAMEAFQKSIDLSEGRYARPQFAYGLVLCRQGNPREAETIIRHGLDTDANSPEGHLFLGIALLGQDRLDEAEKSLHEALLRKPQYPDAYLVLGDVHARKGDYRSQVLDLDTYLKLAPKSSSSTYVRQVRDAAKRRISSTASDN